MIYRQLICWLLMISLSPSINARTAFGIQTLADPMLQACVIRQMQKMQWNKAEQLLTLKCHNQGIQSLAGLEQFSELKELSLYKNKIQVADLQAFAKIEKVNLAANKLSRFEINGSLKIKKLYLFHNRLTHLEIKHCASLQLVKANNNQLEQVSLQALPRLKKLYLFNNMLETFEFQRLAALSYLDVRHNPMPDELYDEMDKVAGLTALHDGNAEDWE